MFLAERFQVTQIISIIKKQKIVIDAGKFHRKMLTLMGKTVKTNRIFS